MGDCCRALEKKLGKGKKYENANKKQNCKIMNNRLPWQARYYCGIFIADVVFHSYKYGENWNERNFQFKHKKDLRSPTSWVKYFQINFAIAFFI